ncbi:ABZJ_00895 family protein [Chitinibacteraceae bacterium HSL-7]
MNPTLLAFVGASVATSALLAVLAGAFGFESSTGSTVVPAIAGSYAGAWHFVRTHKRVPEKAEYARFALHALIATWLSSLAIALVLWPLLMPDGSAAYLFGLARSNPQMVGVILGASAFISLLLYWLIRVIFQQFAVMLVKRTA